LNIAEKTCEDTNQECLHCRWRMSYAADENFSCDSYCKFLSFIARSRDLTGAT